MSTVTASNPVPGEWVFTGEDWEPGQVNWAPAGATEPVGYSMAREDRGFQLTVRGLPPGDQTLVFWQPGLDVVDCLFSVPEGQEFKDGG